MAAIGIFFPKLEYADLALPLATAIHAIPSTHLQEEDILTDTQTEQFEREPNAQKLESLKTLTAVIYGLYAASFFVGITVVIGIILNYMKQDEVRGTWLESHFRWQIRTFWFSLLWFTVSAVALFAFIGILGLVATAVWFGYRVVNGWLALIDRRPMYEDRPVVGS